MITIKTLFDSYVAELNALEADAEENGLDILTEDEESIQENIHTYEFALDVCAALAKKGITMAHTDFSSVSEAMYFDVSNSGDVLKLRIATHSSGYDKDVNFEMSQFLRYTTYDVNQCVAKVEKALS